MLLRDKEKETLLTLRNCARGFPATMARSLEIPRSTARHRISALENTGVVKGYMPVVRPEVFGLPFLIRIEIDPEDYKLRGDLEATIFALKNHFQAGIGHAPICFYCHGDSDSEITRVNCVTMTLNVMYLVDILYKEQNIARENIAVTNLNLADGVPDFSKFSFRKEDDRLET